MKHEDQGYSTARERVRSRLWKWRVATGLTLEEVADLTGLSVGMLSRVERGQRQLAPLTKVRVARRLGVPVRELFDVEAVPEEEVAVP